MTTTPSLMRSARRRVRLCVIPICARRPTRLQPCLDLTLEQYRLSRADTQIRPAEVKKLQPERFVQPAYDP